jgi:hypothetical protein
LTLGFGQLSPDDKFHQVRWSPKVGPR